MVRLVKKGFEESVLEASALPYEQRKNFERQLAIQAPSQLNTIAALLKSGDVPVRRLLIEVLARTKPSQGVYDLLLEALFNDSDVKARRRAAAALGSTGTEALQQQLLKAFEQEEHRFVLASIILALGALGFEWTPEWAERVGTQGPVAEAFRKASAKSGFSQDRSLHIPSPSDVRRPASPYILECYPGLEPFVIDEMDMRMLPRAETLGESGWLYIDLEHATEQHLRALGEMRTVMATYVVAAERRIAEVISMDEFLIDTCREIKHTFNRQNDQLGFRLELPRMDSRAQYRKAVVRLARCITAETGLKNSPSNYFLDIRLARIKDSVYVLWRDVRWHDPRRAEQRSVLPASIHPTVAAALCIAGNVNPEDVFCDPCCGAGTVIAERLSLGPVKIAYGFDISSEAIRLSEHNLKRFGPKVDLRPADMRSLPLANDSVDSIAANLPFGIRVGDRSQNRNLYKDFLKEAKRVLTTKGRLVAYTQDAAAFQAACRDTGWQGVRRLTSVYAGGLTVQVYKGLRP